LKKNSIVLRRNGKKIIIRFVVKKGFLSKYDIVLHCEINTFLCMKDNDV
jgi:hypothetical protein